MQNFFDNKIVKTILNIVEIFIFIVVLLYLVFVVAQRVTNNKSVAGYRVFTVATGSMNPKYLINDVIIVKDVNPDKLKVGDDIAYKGERGGLEGILVSHRIIKIEKADDGHLRFYTKGINNKIEDPSFNEDRIIGKVRGKLPIVNELNHVIKNQYGFFFLVFVPLVLVIFLEIAETITNIKLEKGELEEAKYNKEETEDEETEEESEEDSDIVEEESEEEVKESEEDSKEVEESTETVEEEKSEEEQVVEELKERPKKIKAKKIVELLEEEKTDNKDEVI
jgi:signal peptidase